MTNTGGFERLGTPEEGDLLKSMTCNQLGGACDIVFTGNSFDDLAQQSQNHGKDMFGANDAAHMEAMGKMMELMKTEGAMEAWMSERKAEFDALPMN